jgi:deazaflavin-dependent oxidoreductase (nitroreductase family)
LSQYFLFAHTWRAEGKVATEKPYFLKESTADRIFNRLFGLLLRVGIGARYNYLLETRGRRTGRVYTTPVNLLEMDRRRYLVAVRGETGWVRNARAAGSILLRKANRRMEFRVREVEVSARAPILKEFLDRYAAQVQRFYPVPKGAPVESFREMASRAPVFELQE